MNKELEKLSISVENTITCLEENKKDYNVKVITIDYAIDLLKDINNRINKIEVEYDKS